MIKKIAALLVGATMVLCSFAGCGGTDNSEIVGQWVPSTVSLNGETVKYSELGVDYDQFGFVFESGGKCTATLAGISGSGSYTFNGTSVDVEVNNDVKKLNYDKGVLTLALDYGNDTTTFTFTKSSGKE